jgi:HAD superfamily hydrolase (TIGR01509 family)
MTAPVSHPHSPTLSGVSPPPDWAAIDTVLLDLDGTLLDLAFDTYFWWHHIPTVYGAPRSLGTDAAREYLKPRFKACEGTLNWYCVDYWSRELGLDVPALKRAAGERIGWLPGAEEFLRRLRAQGKRLVLMTNAHPEALRIKDERTGVKRYFDAVHSSHEFGAPKEDARFWAAVRKVEHFDAQRSLFIDDSPPVLRAARAAGIRWVYAVRRPDSTGTPRIHDAAFPVTDGVGDLVDSLGSPRLGSPQSAGG